MVPPSGRIRAVPTRAHGSAAFHVGTLGRGLGVLSRRRQDGEPRDQRRVSRGRDGARDPAGDRPLRADVWGHPRAVRVLRHVVCQRRLHPGDIAPTLQRGRVRVFRGVLRGEPGPDRQAPRLLPGRRDVHRRIPLRHDGSPRGRDPPVGCELLLRVARRPSPTDLHSDLQRVPLRRIRTTVRWADPPEDAPRSVERGVERDPGAMAEVPSRRGRDLGGRHISIDGRAARSDPAGDLNVPRGPRRAGSSGARALRRRGAAPRPARELRTSPTDRRRRHPQRCSSGCVDALAGRDRACTHRAPERSEPGADRRDRCTHRRSHRGPERYNDRVPERPPSLNQTSDPDLPRRDGGGVSRS